MNGRPLIPQIGGNYARKHLNINSGFFYSKADPADRY